MSGTTRYVTGLSAHFHVKRAEDRMYGKTATDMALTSKLMTIPREAIQNTDDAGLEGETPEIVFRFETLEGETLEKFLAAIDWEELQKHMEAVAETDDSIGVEEALKQVRDGTLNVLVVEDKHAEGLDGAEDSKKTNYSSLVKDFGITTKEGDQAGSEGVGSSIFYGFSGFKTVLFNTVPADLGDGETPPRLVGRVDLPDHELEEKTYSGDGWLGVNSTEYDRPVSAWGEAAEAIVEDLNISRPDEPGTSIAIVGFREPTRSTRSPEEVVNRLYEATAQHYWPALVNDAVKVSVQGPSDPDPQPVEPETVPKIAPYIDAYERAASPEDSLDEAGTVVVSEVPFQVPPLKDGTTYPESQLRLVVRRPEEDDPNTLRNKVALFRGARHVVKYRRYDHVARTAGQDFVGLLLVGGANQDLGDALSDENQAAERFFRDAEPEEHDDWTGGTSKLENRYEGEGVDLIRDLLRNRIQDELHKVLATAKTDDENRLPNVGKEFPFFPNSRLGSGGPGKGGGGGGSSPFEEVSSESRFDGRTHHYEGKLVTADTSPGKWMATVEIEEVDGANRKLDSVDVADVDAPLATRNEVVDGAAELEFPAGTRTAEFEVDSVEVGDGGDLLGGGQTRLKISYDFD
jgi:hypothetical protein